MNTFPNKEIPNPDESLYSIFYRVARANHYDHLGSMLKHIAPDIYVTNCNYIDEEHVKAATLLEFGKRANVDVMEYALNKYNHLLVDSINFPTDNAANFQSHRVYQKYSTKFCPLCIQEDFYHRLEWDISLVTMCYKHQVKLIDSCPNCHEKILLNRFMRNQCKCGFSFLHTKEYLTEENGLVINAQKAIYKYLMRDQFQEFEEGEFLAKDYFFFFFKFCFLMDNKEMSNFPSFNEISLNKRINFLHYNLEKRDVNMMRFITALAHSVTVEPNKYIGEIIHVWFETKDISLESYNNKYKYFKEIFNHEQGFLYQSAYDKYLMSQKDVYANGSRLFKGSLQDKKYVTRSEALKMLKTEWTTLQNLCEYGLLTHQITNKGNKEIHLIEKKSVENYLKMKKESVTLQQLTSFLGVNFQIARELAERGFIQALHGPNKDGYSLWYFKRQEAEEFLNHFIVKSQKEIITVDSKWIAFESANCSLRPYGIDTVDLIELLRKGTFPYAILTNNKTIKGICISAFNLEKYIDCLQKELIKQHGFRIKQLQRVFKVGMPKIQKWIEEGKINVTYEETNWCGTTSRYVSKEETKKALMDIKGWDFAVAEEYLNTLLDKGSF